MTVGLVVVVPTLVVVVPVAIAVGLLAYFVVDWLFTKLVAEPMKRHFKRRLLERLDMTEEQYEVWRVKFNERMREINARQRELDR